MLRTARQPFQSAPRLTWIDENPQSTADCLSVTFQQDMKQMINTHLNSHTRDHLPALLLSTRSIKHRPCPRNIGPPVVAPTTPRPPRNSSGASQDSRERSLLLIPTQPRTDTADYRGGHFAAHRNRPNSEIVRKQPKPDQSSREGPK
jgi:hypothetical protein